MLVYIPVALQVFAQDEDGEVCTTPEVWGSGPPGSEWWCEHLMPLPPRVGC